MEVLLHKIHILDHVNIHQTSATEALAHLVGRVCPIEGAGGIHVRCSFVWTSGSVKASCRGTGYVR